MKRILSLAVIAAVILGLSACGSSTTSNNQIQDSASAISETVEAATSENESDKTTEEAANSDAQKEEAVTDAGSHMLVAYFSATGTTEGVAEKIAEALSADLYEIVPAEIYTDEDLDWNDKSSRTTIEQNDAAARPGIEGSIENWEQYDVVLIGYPIWWAEEPRIMDTFVENYDFDGKTVVVFCTSGGSGIGNSGSNLESLAGNGTWLKGQRFSSSVSAGDIVSWADGLGIR